MSSRGGPVGASNRADLFSSARRDENEGKSSRETGRAEETIPSSRERMQDEYGVSGADEDPLQLEHILGYAGDYRGTLLALPSNPDLYVKR